MKNYHHVEVVLFPEYAFTDWRRKELVRWLGTRVQPAIDRQQKKTRKLYLRVLKDTPAIYMS